MMNAAVERDGEAPVISEEISYVIMATLAEFELNEPRQDAWVWRARSFSLTSNLCRAVGLYNASLSTYTKNMGGRGKKSKLEALAELKRAREGGSRSYKVGAC